VAVALIEDCHVSKVAILAAAAVTSASCEQPRPCPTGEFAGWGGNTEEIDFHDNIQASEGYNAFVKKAHQKHIKLGSVVGGDSKLVSTLPWF